MSQSAGARAPRADRARGGADLALLSALALIWGSSNLMVKVAVAEIPPMTAVAARIAVACLAFAALSLARPVALKAAARDWRALAPVALYSYVLAPFLIAFGLARVESGLGAIAVGSVPIFTAALSHLVTRQERLGLRAGAGVLVGFAGIVALMGPAAVGGKDGDPVGLAAVLAGAFSYALTNVIAHRAGKHDAVAASTVVLLIAAAVLVPLSLAFDAPWTLKPGMTALAATAGLGIVVTGLGLVVFFRLIARTGPTFVATVNYLTPLVGAALGVAVLGERLGWNGFLALALILAGVGLTTLARR